MKNKTLTLRPKLRFFADSMEMVLQANDWKGGWEKESIDYLITRLHEEVEELLQTIQNKDRPFGDGLKEACDVANIAMMIADNCGDFPYLDDAGEMVLIARA